MKMFLILIFALFANTVSAWQVANSGTAGRASIEASTGARHIVMNLTNIQHRTAGKPGLAGVTVDDSVAIVEALRRTCFSTTEFTSETKPRLPARCAIDRVGTGANGEDWKAIAEAL